MQGSMQGAADARFREVIGSLVKHLHAFGREVHLTHEEWNAGIDFLWRAGRISDDKRNEFVLTSDVLGLSSLVDLLNGSTHGTESSVLGPFYVAGAPLLRVGASIVGDNSGERVLLRGQVLDATGQPLAGALLDFWQTDADGQYSQALPAIVAHDLDFHAHQARTFPHREVASGYRADPAHAHDTALRNGTLQGAYLMLAARALGLDIGPMSGFHNDVVDATFFADTSLRSNFLCNLGNADLLPRQPRLSFDEVCSWA
ncbi:MAG: dioxygenase [Burkholderiaceae bacterium]